MAPFVLTVDRESEVPLGTQLGWKLRALIRTGRAAPGRPAGAAPPRRGGGERARRRRLRDEIAELDRELVYLQPLGPAGERPSLPAGRILTAAELEEVRAGLATRVDELRADRADARRRAQLPPEPEPARRPAPSAWRHAGWGGGGGRPGGALAGKRARGGAPLPPLRVEPERHQQRVAGPPLQPPGRQLAQRRRHREARLTEHPQAGASPRQCGAPLA